MKSATMFGKFDTFWVLFPKPIRQVMKKIILFAALAAGACNPQTKEEPAANNATDSTTKPVVELPFTASYSDKWEMGNPEHVKIVGHLWKAFDDNAFENTRQYFADTVYMLFSDGSETRGPADSIINEAKKYRSSLTSVRSEIAAWFPTKSTDKDESWVGVWASQVTIANGKTDSSLLHEIWQLDKNDKVVAMRQYRGAMPVKK